MTNRKGRRHAVPRKYVILSVNGFDFKLLPLSVDQLTRYGAVFQSFAEAHDALRTATDATAMAALASISAALVEARDVMHETLYASAVAGGMIDFEEDGEARFEEWFGQLPLMPALESLMPKLSELTKVQQPWAIAYRESAKRSWAN